MDLTTMTPEELQALLVQVQQEVQARSTEQRLKDMAWQVVMEAKAKGYTRGQVTKHLTDVVKQAWGEKVDE